MLIKVWRDPYDSGFNTTNPKEIELNDGLTVLVGCNGAGKTTLLMNIQEHCKNNKIPCHFYNNLRDGGDQMGAMIAGVADLPCDSMSLAASMWTASEGEAIKLNIGRQSTMYKEFLSTGYFKNRNYRFSKLFNEDKTDAEVETNQRVLLFDATDSGLSIDNICDLKELFKVVITEAKEKGLEVYLIISANEYELCRNEDCFDVNKGRYLSFRDYEDYRNFIISSRKNKEKRIEKQIAWREKRLAKEKEQYKKLKTENETKIAEIKSRDTGNGLSWGDRSKIDNLERQLKDFVRDCRFLSEKDVAEDIEA